LGELGFERELVAVIRRAQQQPAVDRLLACLLAASAARSRL
ncbi:MAG TPA: LysR family transcriptional regulator, partial [Pseudomonas sp.]|nr:LysR family transcriptional regulator [Pseudomonas sp.]